MSIVKQGMWNWPGINGKMTSQRDLKLKISTRLLKCSLSLFILIQFDLWTLAVRISHLMWSYALLLLLLLLLLSLLLLLLLLNISRGLTLQLKNIAIDVRPVEYVQI